MYEESREESQTQAGDYYDDGKVEIEVVPQLTSMVQTNYEIGDDDDAIIDILPQSYDRGGFKTQELDYEPCYNHLSFADRSYRRFCNKRGVASESIVALP